MPSPCSSVLDSYLQLHLVFQSSGVGSRRRGRESMKALCVLGLIGSVVLRWASGFGSKERPIDGNGTADDPLLVNLTLIQSAVAKGAVCLDGTPPGYHLDQGFGSGANNWLIFLEGGGWCNNVETCVDRKKTRRGSSNYMPIQIPFAGILSNKPRENPDFYNWKRVRVRYCDGASFAGEGDDEVAGLYFRGQRIWSAAMDDLMSKAMHLADQVILSGSSAGGVACILHCDDFRALFPESTKIKCLVDAGFFLDAVDVAGRHTLRSFYEGVVNLQGVAKNLPRACAVHMDATSCFFPQNLVANIQTPTFLLNAAYVYWQVHQSLAPSSADPHGYWKECKSDISKCNADQIQFLQGFREQMLDAVKGFSASKENGLFINSCFAHGQVENQDTWYGDDSPAIASKGIAQSVGDWYFDRAEVKLIDCPYPCDETCHNLVFSPKPCSLDFPTQSST